MLGECHFGFALGRGLPLLDLVTDMCAYCSFPAHENDVLLTLALYLLLIAPSPAGILVHLQMTGDDHGVFCHI